MEKIAEFLQKQNRQKDELLFPWIKYLPRHLSDADTGRRVWPRPKKQTPGLTDVC